jgi:hypothetical protein
MDVVLGDELDFRPHKKGVGGSRLGRQLKHCPAVLKEHARLLGIKYICLGNESHFENDPNARTARFTAKVWYPLVPKLWKAMPKECSQYFDGRITPPKWPNKQMYQAHLIMNRVHKQYYIKGGARGKSIEHPQVKALLSL